MKRATAVRHYAINRIAGGELLAWARSFWVWVDLKTGKPIRIPSEFKEDMLSNIVHEQA